MADAYATWDPTKATDAPDGWPDKAIVPLVEELRSRGIVTLQSCAGHPGESDGTLWVLADTVDGVHIRRFLAGDPFARVQLVHHPERRWEFVWEPQQAHVAMRALRELLPPPEADSIAQNRPADAPPSVATAPADPDAPRDTPEAQRGSEGLILGRALLDRDGHPWPYDSHPTPEAYGPARGVLLVDPKVGRVLEAAMAMVTVGRFGLHVDEAWVIREAYRRLAAAVDAAESDQPADEGKAESSRHGEGIEPRTGRAEGSRVNDPCADIPDAPDPGHWEPPSGGRFRNGRKVTRNVYLATPGNPTGIDVGRIDHSPELAAWMVEAANARLAAMEEGDGG